MPTKKQLLGLSFTLGAWFTSQTALADIAPPPGYVEQCTVAKFQSPSRSCEECQANFSSVDACEEKLGLTHKRMCKTNGASVWSEVWCEPNDIQPANPEQPSLANTDEPAKPSEETEPNRPVDAQPANTAAPSSSKGGCAGCTLSANSSAPQAFFGLLGLAGAIWLRRRRG